MVRFHYTSRSRGSFRTSCQSKPSTSLLSLRSFHWVVIRMVYSGEWGFGDCVDCYTYALASCHTLRIRLVYRSPQSSVPLRFIRSQCWLVAVVSAQSPRLGRSSESLHLHLRAHRWSRKRSGRPSQSVVRAKSLASSLPHLGTSIVFFRKI